MCSLHEQMHLITARDRRTFRELGVHGQFWLNTGKTTTQIITGHLVRCQFTSKLISVDDFVFLLPLKNVFWLYNDLIINATIYYPLLLLALGRKELERMYIQYPEDLRVCYSLRCCFLNSPKVGLFLQETIFMLCKKCLLWTLTARC